MVTRGEFSCPVEARSEYLRGHKRQRSPAVGSAKKSSDGGWIKCRPSEIPFADVPVSHAFKISDRRLGNDGEPNQFCIKYNAVFALLMDLQGSNNQDVDDRTSTLIGELSEYLARLKITRLRLTRNDVSGIAVVATGMDCQEIVLASLTPSELMSSTAELAAHILHMVQLQNSRPASTPTVPVGDPPRRAYVITDNNRSQTVDSIKSRIPIPAARRYGLTYPSALLDCTTISGCSVST